MIYFLLIRFVFALLLTLIATPGLSDTLQGKMVRIVDGDTLVFLDQSNTQHKVRLSGIDTPERGQPFGKRATENLARLGGKKPARLEWNKKDRWKRIIGEVWVQSPDSPREGSSCPKTLDVNLAQLTTGLAWHYKKYANEQSEEDRERYSFAEVEARARKAGLWSDPNAIAPWEWRKK